MRTYVETPQFRPIRLEGIIVVCRESGYVWCQARLALLTCRFILSMTQAGRRHNIEHTSNIGEA